MFSDAFFISRMYVCHRECYQRFIDNMNRLETKPHTDDSPSTYRLKITPSTEKYMFSLECLSFAINVPDVKFRKEGHGPQNLFQSLSLVVAIPFFGDQKVIMIILCYER